MRFLHTADLHLDTPLGAHSRLPTQFDQFDYVVKAAVEGGCHAFLIVGDVFFEKLAGRRLSYVLAELSRRLLPLVDAGIQIVALPGNHDEPIHFAMMQRLVELAARAAGKPQPLFTVVTENSVIDLPQGMQAVVLPYPSKERADHFVDPATPSEQIAAARNMAVTAYVAEELHRLMPQLRPEAQAICLAHFHVTGAVFTQKQTDGFQHLWERDFIVPAGTLALPRFRYVGLGHIHEQQRLPNVTVPMWYCGSQERLNRSEASSEKGALIVDVPAGDGPVIVTPVPIPASVFRDITCTSSELEQTLSLISEIERRTEYVTCTVTLDGGLTREAVLRLLRATFPRHLKLKVIDPAAVLVAAPPTASDGQTALPAYDVRATVDRVFQERFGAAADAAYLRTLLDGVLSEVLDPPPSPAVIAQAPSLFVSTPSLADTIPTPQVA